MQSINMDKIPDILESAWHMRDEIVICFLGAPGIGKTQQIYQFAERKGAKVVEIIASQILPNEVSGITMPVDSSHSMEIYDHARLASLEDGDILFFDELLQASPQVLSACLTLIQERRMMSGKKLPDIMIIAAANETSSPKMIPAAIRQRFMFTRISFNENKWRVYMRDTYGIEVPNIVSSEIHFNDVDWNMMTPRTLTKLILWRQKLTTKPASERLAWKKFVQANYGKTAAENIENMFVRKSNAQLVYDALVDSRMFSESELEIINGELIDASSADILAKLQALVIWPDIEKVLSEMKWSDYA